jgi:hypothetical protein
VTSMNDWVNYVMRLADNTSGKKGIKNGVGRKSEMRGWRKLARDKGGLCRIPFTASPKFVHELNTVTASTVIWSDPGSAGVVAAAAASAAR